MIQRSRSLTFLLACCLLVTLSGCNRAELNKKLIFIIVPSLDNPFFKAEAEAASQRARELGYRVRTEVHNGDPYQQDNMVDAAIASNASALILDNAGRNASIAAVRRATRAGIAVFLVDRDIAIQGIAKAQIISDNRQGAQLVAREFAGALGDQGEYAELLGIESDTNARVRSRGFHSVLDTYPGLKMVAAQAANWSESEAFAKTEVILQAHSHIAGIIVGNDTMALGAVAAVKTAGLKHIVITGFDGSPDALAAIRSGELLATSLQPAVYMAQLAVNEANQYLKTGNTEEPERQTIPCHLVTRANVGNFKNFQLIR